jgi:hypothetical protein
MGYEEERRMCDRAMQVPRYEASGIRIMKGMLLWDNDLQVVQVDGTMHASLYQGTHVQVWHNHTRGSSDDGRWGRLARRFPQGMQPRDAASPLPLSGETPEQWMARTGKTELHEILAPQFRIRY